MPLRDHFHDPLESQHSWASFHGTWAGDIMRSLNALLPERYLAEMHTHLGSRIEADIVEFERIEPTESPTSQSNGGVALQTWAPTLTALTMPAVFPDEFEIEIVDTQEGKRLVGVIELVSPGNLDRPEHRRAFAAKMSTYLQRGIGLVIVDIVTSRQFNLHNEYLDLMNLDANFRMADNAFLYSTAYQPIHRHGKNEIDFWPQPLVISEPLPTMPLSLRGGPRVPIELEKTYSSACQGSRI